MHCTITSGTNSFVLMGLSYYQYFCLTLTDISTASIKLDNRLPTLCCGQYVLNISSWSQRPLVGMRGLSSQLGALGW